MFFSLYGNPKIGLLLKSYKATTVNGKSTVTITCETTDHFQLGMALRELADTAKAQKEAAKANVKAAEREAKKPKPKAPLLALPAPQLALPAPLRALPKPGGAA